jgi:hypothetical protein
MLNKQTKDFVRVSLENQWRKRRCKLDKLNKNRGFVVEKQIRNHHAD